jgi:hypothetical protein
MTPPQDEFLQGTFRVYLFYRPINNLYGKVDDSIGLIKGILFLAEALSAFITGVIRFSSKWRVHLKYSSYLRI